MTVKKRYLIHMILGVFISLTCIYYLTNNIHYDEIIVLLSSIDIFYLCGAIFIRVSSFIVLAFQLKFVSLNRVDFSQSFISYTLSGLINLLIPVKLGDLYRLYYFKQQDSSISSVSGIEWLIWERLPAFTFACLVILFNLPNFVSSKSIFILGLFVLLCWILILGALASRKNKTFISKFLPPLLYKILWSDFLSKYDLSYVLGICFYSLVVILFEIGTTTLCLRSLNAEFPIHIIMSIYSVAIVSFLIPSGPGAIGVFQAAVTGAILFFGVADKPVALTISLVLHFAFIAPLFVALVICGMGKVQMQLRQKRAPG